MTRLTDTMKRRWSRMSQRFADRRALRAERRLHPKGDVGDAARMAEGDAWRKGGRFYN